MPGCLTVACVVKKITTLLAGTKLGLRIRGSLVSLKSNFRGGQRAKKFKTIYRKKKHNYRNISLCGCFDKG